jgi:UDP-2-acetamido-2-deoxy-ribo-hexuluronate aminotransferase
MEFIDLKAQYQASRALINARIQTVLDHGQYIMGPKSPNSKAPGRYTGARHCITVASGTEALLIALMALGIKAGRRSHHHPVHLHRHRRGHRAARRVPVFVDIDPGTCNLDPALIEARITPRTRAIMPVSLYGQPADMDEINAIAARHGLAVIEDAAQSFGASYRGRSSGNLSTSAAPASSPASRSAAMATAAPCSPATTSWPGHARDPRARPVAALRAYPYRRRRPHGHAAMRDRAGQARMFDWELQQRRRAAATYDALLLGRECGLLRCARTAPAPGPSTRSCWRSAMRCRRRCRRPASRPRCTTRCRSTCSRPTRTWTRKPAARWRDALAARVMSLPMGPYMPEADIRTVCSAVLAALPHEHGAEPGPAVRAPAAPLTTSV